MPLLGIFAWLAYKSNVMAWQFEHSTLGSFPSMHCLPVELLDEILSLAIALGIITPNEASCICRRWRSFQRFLFKSIRLDPFDDSILDLNEHIHLTSYVEVLQVVPRPGSPRPSYASDLSPSFANFLCNLQNPSSMIFCDSRIQWANVSSRSKDSFLTVFRRDSFRSLEISVHNPLPSWMLLYGLGIASKLTIHYAGQIIAPLLCTRLVLNQCSLTHLVLFGNAAIRRMAKFCLQLRPSPKILLQQLTHLVLEYVETELNFGPPMAPFVDKLIALSGAQLEVIDIRILSSSAFEDAPQISTSALARLTSLKCLSIRFAGYSTGNNALTSAAEYICSFLQGLPSPSTVTSLSLRVDEQREVNTGTEEWKSQYQNLLSRISEQLAHTKKWPHPTSASILVDVRDGFTEPFSVPKGIEIGPSRHEIVALLRVNNREAGNRCFDDE